MVDDPTGPKVSFDVQEVVNLGGGPFGDTIVVITGTDNGGPDNGGQDTTRKEIIIRVQLTVLPGVYIENAKVTEGNEGTRELRFSVRLTNSTDHPVTVDVRTIYDQELFGYAIPNDDYKPSQATLTFAPTEIQKFFSVSVYGDFLPEGESIQFRPDFAPPFPPRITAERVSVRLEDSPQGAVIVPVPYYPFEGCEWVGILEPNDTIAHWEGHCPPPGFAIGYIVDDDVSDDAQPGHMFKICSENTVELIEVELVQVTGSQVLIHPDSTRPCGVIVTLIGQGSATFPFNDGKRIYTATFQGPGRYPLQHHSLIIQTDEGLALINYELDNVVHEVQVAPGASAELSSLSGEAGEVRAVEIKAGGIEGSVLADGFSLIPDRPVLTLTSQIDIKPGSSDNAVKLGAGGTLPVAILSAADFDATTVNPLTVLLAGAPVQVRRDGKPLAAAEDVNKDRRLDLVVQIVTSQLQLKPNGTRAILTGQAYGGTVIFRGADAVSVVQK